MPLFGIREPGRRRGRDFVCHHATDNVQGETDKQHDSVLAFSGRPE